MESTTNLASERGTARLATAARGHHRRAVLTPIAFDVSAVVVNIFQLDDLSRSAAREAAEAWRGSPRAAAVEAAVANEVAPGTSVEVSRITLDATTVWVTLRRPPSVIMLDKVPAVRERLDISITQRATLDPAGL